MLNIIRFPLSMFPTVLNSSIVTFVSAKRFSRFLNGKDTVPNKATPDFRQDEDFDVYLRNTSFFWDRDCEKAAIKINGEENVLKEIKIGKGELVMITGRVGSGKSAFLGSLLGELTQKDGDAVDLGEVAYVAQTAWVLLKF
ncbi:Canalicular multispecific organic anion transporter 1 [Bonamia ostreae]|uniref:Canalicular multispecific organic anion transporter 1 n=1 Tax=Bonamia ostreae TaxID=126728 RepID=A0ABV2ATS4_9EUKA